VAGGRRNASERAQRAGKRDPKAIQITFAIDATFSRPFFFSAEKGGRGWFRGSRGDFILGLK
jgi:hypothetical protein